MKLEFTPKTIELHNIRSTLQLNKFPTRTTFLAFRQPCSQNTQYNHFTSIPYIQGTSEKNQKSSKRGKGKSCFETH